MPRGWDARYASPDLVWVLPCGKEVDSYNRESTDPNGEAPRTRPDDHPGLSAFGF